MVDVTKLSISVIHQVWLTSGTEQLAGRDDSTIGFNAQRVIKKLFTVTNRFVPSEESRPSKIECHSGNKRFVQTIYSLIFHLEKLHISATFRGKALTVNQTLAPTTNGYSSLSSCAFFPLPIFPLAKSGRHRYNPMSIAIRIA
jgi:hypothetical protein